MLKELNSFVKGPTSFENTTQEKIQGLLIVLTALVGASYKICQAYPHLYQD